MRQEEHDAALERAVAIFVDGIGAAAASSGVLNQLQGRIFGLLYLEPEPLSLDEIAERLQQSKSNISINIRGLVEWQLVRRTTVAGSRKDHYEAATDFWRVMQEIMERRFRWNLRQVLAAVAETERAAGLGDAPSAAELGGSRGRKPSDTTGAFLATRLKALRFFFSAVDAGVGAFTQGRAIEPDSIRKVFPMPVRRNP